MDVFIKEIGMIILNMEKGMKNLQMVLYILELMLMGNLKDMVHIVGKMERHMKVNGWMM